MFVRSSREPRELLARVGGGARGSVEGVPMAPPESATLRGPTNWGPAAPIGSWDGVGCIPCRCGGGWLERAQRFRWSCVNSSLGCAEMFMKSISAWSNSGGGVGSWGGVGGAFGVVGVSCSVVS